MRSSRFLWALLSMYVVLCIPLAAQTCGPPTYSCSSTSTANPGTITPLYNSTLVNNNPATCSGDCVNTVKYDTKINPSGTDPYVRVTDGTTYGGFTSGKSVGNLTCSGGDNDVMMSKTGKYLGGRRGGLDPAFE